MERKVGWKEDFDGYQKGSIAIAILYVYALANKLIHYTAQVPSI